MFSLLLAVIYISFISLGLPDALLGSAWPVMYAEMQVPVSYSGIIFMVISVGTVISSLNSDRLTRRLGTAKVTAISVAMTALALFGFSLSHSFSALCLWAIPYGLGAGSVDACLNNYMALHYESRHMSWLHCMWGLGVTIGPYILAQALTHGMTWNMGYRFIGVFQTILTSILLLSIPLWKTTTPENSEHHNSKPANFLQLLSIPGVTETMMIFFCYCSLEQTVGLWSSSYLVFHRNIPEEIAAGFGALFFIGITVGRFLSGFLTMRLRDQSMVWLGLGIITVGISLILLPLGDFSALAGLIFVGLGCAPVYPCLIHATPHHFGEDHSQALIGLQMASAYVGTSLLPPFFGVAADWIDIALFPAYLLVLLLIMVFMHRRLCLLVSHNTAY